MQTAAALQVEREIFFFFILFPSIYAAFIDLEYELFIICHKSGLLYPFLLQAQLTIAS